MRLTEDGLRSLTGLLSEFNSLPSSYGVALESAEVEMDGEVFTVGTDRDGGAVLEIGE